MTNALDPKTPILKGVITEVLDDGNAGKINCGHGNIYTFVSDQLETGYLPVLKDVVEFNLIEDQPFAIACFIVRRHSIVPAAAEPVLIFA